MQQIVEKEIKEINHIQKYKKKDNLIYESTESEYKASSDNASLIH